MKNEPTKNKVENNKKLIFEADLYATNDLRSAIYNYDFKTITNLQLINGAGFSILAGFLSQNLIRYSIQAKYCFFISLTLFLLGVILSVGLSFISTKYIELRYRQNESAKRNTEYQSYNCYRNFFLSCALISFALASLSAMGGLYYILL